MIVRLWKLATQNPPSIVSVLGMLVVASVRAVTELELALAAVTPGQDFNAASCVSFRQRRGKARS